MDARRAYNAARLDDHIRDTLAKAPPLTQEQRDKLAELLTPVRVTRARDLPGGAA